MNVKETILIFTLIIFSQYIFAQSSTTSPAGIYFEPFEGMAYLMPIVEKRNGKLISKSIVEHYTPDVLNYKPLGAVKLEKVNIPETTIGHGVFPGVKETTGFCMILNSRMFVKKDGCYIISLNSDDGSILWIDDQLVLDNDGGHQMKLKRDTIALTKGAYAARLWYFQGMPDRFGLIMDTKYLGEMSLCNGLGNKDEFEINSELLFATGAYKLLDSARQRLDVLLGESIGGGLKSIEIIGHTDNVGSEESNMELSQKRSDAIASYIKQKLDPNVKIIALGMGETDPKATNDTSEGRSINRRVEIILHFE